MIHRTAQLSLALLFLVLVSLPLTADDTQYFYDDLGRLIRVERADCTIVTYTYDSVGNRLSKTAVVDQDCDTVRDTLDCAPDNDRAWQLPGEATNLDLALSLGAATLEWSAPSNLGGPSTAYDTVRSTTAGDFGPSAMCLEADGSDTTSADPEDPLSGTGHFYLVRAENACGVGSAGTDSAGTPRSVRDCDPPPTITVFISSVASNAALGGLSGADTTCATLAANAGLLGTYLAWLSDSVDSPSTRFTQSTLPYVLVDGTRVADDWADFTDGTLQHGIDLDENGTLLTGWNVWTGTLVDGTASADPNCSDWTGGTKGSVGHMGQSGQTGSAWTDAATSSCFLPDRHLYCVEQ